MDKSNSTLSSDKQKHTSDSEKRVEEELMRLRERLWTVRGRHSRITGLAFLVVSGIFLLLAYVTRYIVFEVTSILALLLGVVFVFIGVESYVKMVVANRAVFSVLAPLARFMNHVGINGEAIYLPASDVDSSRIFVRVQDRNRLQAFEDFVEPATTDVNALGEGLFFPSIGSGLLQLYEEELGDVRNFDLDYLLEWFPRVFVEGLKMAGGMEVHREDDEIEVKLKESAFRYLCQHSVVRRVCETIGCPVSSSIGETIAKNTGRIVYYVKCEYDPIRLENKASYKLGPPLESLKGGKPEVRGKR